MTPRALFVLLLAAFLPACSSEIQSGWLGESLDGGTGGPASESSTEGALFTCLGRPSVHASLCPNDDRDLIASIDMAVVPACTSDTKCEYQCDAGYIAQNNECVLDPNATNICEATGGARCFYIAPNGSDANDGSIGAPFASTNPIINSIAAGDFIYFRGGTYGEAAKGQIPAYSPWVPPYHSIAYITRSGAEGKPITFKAYPGELPVLDLYDVNPEYDPTSLEDGANDAFALNATNHIRIEGFEIVHGSIYVSNNSKYTWIENNHIHDLLTNRDNNGLIMLYFTQHAYVRNNNLHDTYSRKISDGSGGWILNTVKSHEDAQHNGCITTLSGDTYVGYGSETSGPFEISGNDIHDCPVHLFIKNPQGESVNDDGLNMLVKDNTFHGAGSLAEWFEASNVLFENNLFEDIGGISAFGHSEFPNASSTDPLINEIAARNVTFRHNVFSNVSYVVQMQGQGFLSANGIYSTAMEDKFKFYDNVVVVSDGSASTAGAMGWDQHGMILGNAYAGMIDSAPTPSKTLSRIDSMNNCFVNKHGTNLAFLKHWVNGGTSITGYTHAVSKTMYGINGSGDLFPSDTTLATHFADPAIHDYSIKATSPCAAISGVGLLNPGLFVE